MYPRHILARVTEALADTPVVLLQGARQTGKSTLVAQLIAQHQRASYVTLDNLAALSAAQADPTGFLADLGTPAAIDEVQLAPGLFRAIKEQVDRDRRPGRYLLTGSADVMLLPAISESLAGRIERITLWPLAESELRGTTGNFVDRLFAGELPRVTSDLTRADLLGLALRGGYPEAVARAAGRRRTGWFESYVDTMLRRDVRQLANIEGLTQMPRLLALLASRATGLLNASAVARDLGMERKTVGRYLDLLELAYLVKRLPAWSRNLGKRLTRAPKLLLTDTGVMGYLLGIEGAGPALERAAGALLENFVGLELHKALAWSATRAGLYHYRTADGAEVDLVLERSDGAVAAVEVKAAASLTAGDFRPLQTLQATLGDDLVAGVILYGGRETVGFGPGLRALPCAALWG
jgi:predicted AAA+ superfamily ATPase